ncbi:MAG: SRPBCC family protein [Chitinophagales bacterium]
MKTLKKILIGLASLIAILLLAAVFISTDLTIEKEIIISKPRQEVFNYIRLLRNQENYSKWAMMDPHMKKEYRGKDGEVGFVSAWSSTLRDVGVGEQEIKKIKEGERIDMEIRFKEPFESTDPAFMTTDSLTSNQTRVKWGYLGKMNYPTNLMIPVVKGQLETDIATGLENLKRVLEK